MKFKYNFLAISLLGAMAVGCEPMEDIYDEIDAQETVITKTLDEYVLTKADYDAISKAAEKDAANKDEEYLAGDVAKMQALNKFASADKYVPAILAKMYPTWGKGSSVGVTYNLYEKTEGLASSLRGIKNGYLKDTDYDAIWEADGISGVHFFSPKHAPEAELPAFLAKNFADAKENDKVLVDYKYDNVDPKVIPGEDLINEAFDGVTKYEKVEVEGWKQSILEGKEPWEGRDFNNNKFANISAYKTKGAVKVALITPTIKLESAGGAFTFDMAYGHHNGECLKVYISDKFKSTDSTFVAADWIDITSSFKFANPDDQVNGYTPLVNCGEYKLNSYVGKNITFAFYYEGEDKAGGVTTTVQLDNVKVSTTLMSKTNEQKYNALYEFDGKAWKEYKNDGAVVITPAEYDAMGEPGSHDNFSSSVKADDYIPTYLAQKFPYAKKDETKAVVYKYYAGSKEGTKIYVDEYLLGTTWALNSYINVREKETFIYTDKWIFQPIVNHFVGEADLKYLVSWVAENKPAYLNQKYKDKETWFGADTFYKHMNFNADIKSRRGSEADPDHVVPEDDAEARVYLTKMIGEGVQLILAHNYPNADTQMNGADLYYQVTCKVFHGSNVNQRYVFKFKSLGNGKFELEGEPKVTNW